MISSGFHQDGFHQDGRRQIVAAASAALLVLSILIFLSPFDSSAEIPQAFSSSLELWRSFCLPNNKSNVVVAEAPRRPKPFHCSGLVILNASSGSVTTGTGAPPRPNDCRWVLRIPNASSLTLAFTGVHVPGIFSRVWIFSGEEDVETWVGRDVVETARAFKSFSGDLDPLPINCNGGTALVIFQTEDGDAARAGFTMSWTSSP